MNRIPIDEDREKWNPHNGGLSPPADLTLPEQRTEVAAARMFAAMHGKNVRYCAPWRKWLVWDSKRWKLDATCAVESLAKETAAAYWEAVKQKIQTADKGTAVALIGFANSTSSSRGIEAMLKLARSESGIPILPEQLDAHPYLLNCTNKTVNLRTGNMLAHNREHYLTKLCPHEYLAGSEAEVPIWELTIDRIFGGNQNVIGFFRRYCGSALVGEVVEHILAILWGRGSNGKTLVVETLLEALGPDYADKGAPDLLLDVRGNNHPTAKADLHGKRFIVCNETDRNSSFAETTLKELCGGDTVKARRMREDFWSFKPSHTLVLVTNHKPIVRGTDHGVWRRLRLLPFTQTFWDRAKGETGPAEYEADPRLKDKLRPELPGIVTWLVKACIEWQREGLGQPNEVTVATADYRSSMDVLAAFLDEHCTLGEGFTVKASDIRARYDGWCKENGEKPISGRRFGEQLRERGVATRISNGTWYSGIALR